MINQAQANSGIIKDQKRPYINDTKPSQWQAFLHLELALSKRGVVLKKCEHQGPLYVQKPFYPEGKDLAHLYILHPPGGLVSGDQLTLKCELQKNAPTLLTTPGAGRVYKAREDKALQGQNNHFIVKEGASLEWLPQETILYPNASTQLRTLIELDHLSSYIGWEISCFGLPASGQPFNQGDVKQTLEIRQFGQIKLRDQILINEKTREQLHQVAGFNQLNINGLMVAGPFNQASKAVMDLALEELIEALQQLCEQINPLNHTDLCSQSLASVSLTGEFLLIRYLGSSSEQAKHLYIACWQKIRPLLLNRCASIPRIWAT